MKMDLDSLQLENNIYWQQHPHNIMKCNFDASFSENMLKRRKIHVDGSKDNVVPTSCGC